LTGSAVTAVAVAGSGWLLAFGDGEAEAACLRPPGALAEDAFLATCIRCGRCADACPNRSIVGFTADTGRENGIAPGRRQRGTPVIFPRRQACILCNGAPGEYLLCTEACPSGSLTLTRKDHLTVREQVEMGTAEVDMNLCYSFNGASCGACVRACPFEGSALRAGLWETPLIDEKACVGCGLCERSCVRYPQAIRVRPRNARA
jgi:MauM/NapG family ferredoxin protein